MAKYNTRQKALAAGKDWWGIMPIAPKGFEELFERQDNIKPFYPTIPLD